MGWTAGLRYVLVAVAAHLIWVYISTRNSPTYAALHAQEVTALDYAWGSILQRHDNYPTRATKRAPLPNVPVDVHYGNVRILIVTSELAGLNKNAGIGTAFYELARALARQPSFQVSILITHPRTDFPVGIVGSLTTLLSSQGIQILFLEESPRPIWPSSWSSRASIRIYRFLREHDGDWDVVHFPDNTGIGYFSALGKYEGLALRRTQIVVGLHGADVEWASMLNKRYPSDHYALELGIFERRTCELADVVVSPSEYMLDYVRKRGWRLPPHAYVIPNVLSDVDRQSQPASAPAPNNGNDEQAITEIVFFGRLEERKGAKLFLEALEALVQDKSPAMAIVKKVTFLGRDTIDRNSYLRVSSLLTVALETLQAKYNSSFDFSFLTRLDRGAALAYLAHPARLAVLPALIDNSPSTVLECTYGKIRFIASAVGGVPELVDPTLHSNVLFHPTPTALADALSNLLLNPATYEHATVAAPVSSAIADWHDLHMWLKSRAMDTVDKPSNEDSPVGSPTICICVTHYERTHLVSQLLDSIEQQTYQNFQVVLIDDGSTQATSVSGLAAVESRYFSRPDWRLVRSGNVYLGEARNKAATQCHAPHILFLDDDDVLKPHYLETLLGVARHTNASALSTWLDEFATDVNPLASKTELPHRRTYWFLGSSIGLGMLANYFGSGNVFVNRAAFEAVGGFTPYRDVGAEDWEFYLRLALNNYTQLVVPEELLFVRSDPSRFSMKFAMDQWESPFRALIPLLNDRRIYDLELAQALMFTKSQQMKEVPKPAYAHSLLDFETVPGWKGWQYTFVPVNTSLTFDQASEAFPEDGHWRFERGRRIPYITERAQHPYVATNGAAFAAVRSFRAPRDIHVSVHLNFVSRHLCGDGTDLRLILRDVSPDSPHLIAAYKTMETTGEDVYRELSLMQGSVLDLAVLPLDSDSCDDVQVQLTLTEVALGDESWSAVARAAALQEVEERITATNQGQGHTDWLPVAQTVVGSNEVINIALIFDDNRLAHAVQVLRSALAYEGARRIRAYLIAPSHLHSELRSIHDWPRDIELFAYDYELCVRAVRSVIPFSDPSIHISAHCKAFLGDILSHVDRVLYLDTDVTVLDDLTACYAEPDQTRTLISMSIDMGDVCQLNPDKCWPIGLYRRILSSEGSLLDVTSHMETVQVNGGVILMELDRMRSSNFTRRYLESIIHHYRMTQSIATWGEQDFINSYIRLYPTELEVLPCGCNYQWFGKQAKARCAGEVAHIAHAWSHGIATRSSNPYNQLFYHYLDNISSRPPDIPEVTPLDSGTPATLSDIESSPNCLLQSHPCDSPVKKSFYGDPVLLLTLSFAESSTQDFVTAVDQQRYPNIYHYIIARSAVALPDTAIPTTVLLLDEAAEELPTYKAYAEMTAGSTERNTAPPPYSHYAERMLFYTRYCSLHASVSATMIDRDTLDSQDGWVLYMDDDRRFTSDDALSYIMAHVESKEEIVLFRSNSSSGDQDFEYRKKLIPLGEMHGLGFVFHSSHLDDAVWDEKLCSVHRTLESLSQRLIMRWIDLVPIVQHPLWRHLSTRSFDDLPVDIVIFETEDHQEWSLAAVRELSSQQYQNIVNKIIVMALDDGARDYADHVNVVHAPPGFGLSLVADAVDTEGVLVLTDELLLDKDAIIALLNFWLEDTANVVGPFTLEPQAGENIRESGRLDDSLIGDAPYVAVASTASLTHLNYFVALSRLLEDHTVPPSCHATLINALAIGAGGRPIRVLLPPATILDRVDDCQVRGWPDVVPTRRAGSEIAEPDSVGRGICEDITNRILDSVTDWPKEETFAESGLMGIKKSTRSEPISATEWRNMRMRDECIR